MNVILFALLLAVIIYTVSLIRMFAKRMSAICKIKKLSKENEKIKLKFTRNVFASLFKMSHTPDITAEVGNKIYLVRFYNGRGRRTQVHFANEEYSALFSILLVRNLGGMRGKQSQGIETAASQSTTTIRRRVKIIPKLKIPEEYIHAPDAGKVLVPVFIFNPAPSNVSYVSDEKTSIKLAFTGDKFRDTLIFTGSSFVRYLDREARYENGYIQDTIFHSEI